MIERRKPIKRAALKRPTIEQVRAFSAKPRKAIARVGRKAQREQPALEHFRRTLRERHHGECEVSYLTNDWRNICGTSQIIHAGAHAHHAWPEDRQRSIHDPARGLYLCARAHQWAHLNPEAAAEAGLLRPHGRAVAL